MDNGASGCPAWINADGKVLRLTPTDGDYAAIYQHPECLPLSRICPGIRQPVSVCMDLETPDGHIGALMLSDNGDLLALTDGLNGDCTPLNGMRELLSLDYEGLQEAVAERLGKPCRLWDLVHPSMDAGAWEQTVGQNLQQRRAYVLVLSSVSPASYYLPPPEGTAITAAVIGIQTFQDQDGDTLFIPKPFLQPQQTYPKRGERNFFAAMARLDADLPDALRGFLDRIAECGVAARCHHALSLAWNGVKLATITPTGLVLTDVGIARSELPDARARAHAYVERLAKHLHLKVDRSVFGDVWTLRDDTGHLPNIKTMAYRLDIWADAIERLVREMGS